MQPETSSTVLHKCRCCLIEGEHPHNIHDYFYIKMFRETFNITPVTGWRLPQWICTGCVDSLKEAKRFRDMVTATEKQLIQALPNTHRVQLSADTSIVKAEGSDTDSVDLQDYDPSPSPEEMLSSQEPEIAIVVKAEDDEYTTMTIGPTVVERRVTRRTGRASVETKPEIPSGVSWPEVLEPDLKDNKTDTKQELDEVGFSKSIMTSKFYKYCAVPYCNTTTVKTPHKLFVYVPRAEEIRKKWMNLAGRDPKDFSKDTRIHFCEDHFDMPNDMENYMEYHVKGFVSQVRMKSGCVPTKFDCQPGRRKRKYLGPNEEYILKQYHKMIIEQCLREADSQNTVTAEPSEKKADRNQNDVINSESKEEGKLKDSIAPQCTCGHNGSKVSETPTRTLHSDATKILENIVQTLQHSTILPFRHSQKHIDRFKCFYCENTYELKELREHTESQHVGRVSDKTILSLVRTRSYRAIHAEISCTKCRLCNEEFKTVETLIEHLTKIHEKVYHETRKRSQGILTFDLSSGEMKCHLCNEDFPYFAALSSHMNEHYGDFVCRVCKKKFATKDRCHSHLMKVHIWKEKKQELICDYCNGSFKNRVRLIYHMKNHHLNAVIKCQFCPKTFLFKDDLKRALHMKNEHKAGSITGFQCAICGYITHKKCRFGEHMDTHNGVKKNKCEVCGKRYGTRATLKAHMRCHSDERKYACSVCGAAFRHPSSLKHHTGRKHHDSNT